MTFKPPLSIVAHPAVEEVLPGSASGSDYRYDVLLKDGFVFANGRMEGCQSGRFNNVRDFVWAEPMWKEK